MNRYKDITNPTKANKLLQDDFKSLIKGVVDFELDHILKTIDNFASSLDLTHADFITLVNHSYTNIVFNIASRMGEDDQAIANRLDISLKGLNSRQVSTIKYNRYLQKNGIEALHRDAQRVITRIGSNDLDCDRLARITTDFSLSDRLTRQENKILFDFLYLKTTLDRSRGNNESKQKIADRLEIGRVELYRTLKKFEIPL